MTGLNLREQIEAAVGSAVVSLNPLSGGCIAQVYRAVLVGGESVVVKADAGENPRLDVEGRMLSVLAERSSLPVPGVMHAAPGLLVMEFIESDGRTSQAGEAAAADMLADLHGIGSDRFGLEFDTIIGPLDQPNAWDESWAVFYRDRRLLPMAGMAESRGGLPAGGMSTLRKVADRCVDLIGEHAQPGLIHGDVWGGNVLWHDGGVRAFIDPAVYFADPEVELAFIGLFSCFGPAFWERYHERRPIRAGFEEVRQPLYQLYPLLVHAALFGGGYGEQAVGIARRLVSL